MVNVKHDYSYVLDNIKELINIGLAEYSIHSIHFNVGREEKLSILELLSKKYRIYQYDYTVEYSNRENGICYYRWDLFNSPNDAVDFNHYNYDNKTINDMANNIIDLLNNYNKDVDIRIQYEINFYTDKIEKIAHEKFESINNKFISLSNKKGKIKIVPEYKDSYYGTSTKYGFFPKGSKRKYYPITNMDLCLLK